MVTIKNISIIFMLSMCSAGLFSNKVNAMDAAQARAILKGFIAAHKENYVITPSDQQRHHAHDEENIEESKPPVMERYRPYLIAPQIIKGKKVPTSNLELKTREQKELEAKQAQLIDAGHVQPDYGSTEFRYVARRLTWWPF